MFTAGKYHGQPVTAVEAALRRRGYHPVLITENPDEHLPAHLHSEHHILVGIEGQMQVRVRQQNFTLAAGDEITIPPGTEHEAHAGPDGCSYFWVEY